MKHNNNGFSILLAMGMMLVATLLILTILEYIIPFARNVKGIENSSISYYNASSGVEDALYFLKNNPEPGSEDQIFEPSIDSGEWYNIIANGQNLPLPGTGDSIYQQVDDEQKDWNSINTGNPIQLDFGNNLISSVANFSLYLRVPNIDEDFGTTESLSSSFTGAIINWQLISSDNTLNSDNSYITSNQICSSTESGCSDFPLFSQLGEDLGGSSIFFSQFYNNNCNSGQSCSLKLSMVTPPKTSDNKPVPYIEWQIAIGGLNSLPLRYARIQGYGKSYGFKKSLEIKVPQQTVSEAFDFTVLQ